MLAIYSVFLALLFNQAPLAADATGRLTGRVTAAGTNAPVVGARVMLLPARRAARRNRPDARRTRPTRDHEDHHRRRSPTRMAATSSSGCGRARTRSTVEKTGYAAPIGPSNARTVEIAAGQSIDDVDLHLERGAVIAGRVLDPAGEPLPDARVTAMRRVSPPRSGAAPAARARPGTADQRSRRVPDRQSAARGILHSRNAAQDRRCSARPATTAPARAAGIAAHNDRPRPSIQAHRIRPRRSRSPWQPARKWATSFSRCSPSRLSASRASSSMNKARRSRTRWSADGRSSQRHVHGTGRRHAHAGQRTVRHRRRAGRQLPGERVGHDDFQRFRCRFRQCRLGQRDLRQQRHVPTGAGTTADQPTEVVVVDADVKGVRVPTRRPVPR